MGGTLKMTKGRALRDTTEVPTSSESGLIRQPACAPDFARDRDWRGAGAAWTARPMKQSEARFRAQERRGFSMRRAELVRRGSCGDAGDGGRGQLERSVEVAKPHRPGMCRRSFRAKAQVRGVLCAGCGDELWRHRRSRSRRASGQRA
jgi:hypothetical protein